MVGTTRVPSAFEHEARHLLESGHDAPLLVRRELTDALHARGEQQAQLAARARHVRECNGNDQLLIRASVEFSNHCRQQCSFCGMTVKNTELLRYRLSSSEICEIVNHVSSLGIEHLHLVAGEDWQPGDVLEPAIRYAADRGMEITLVVGQRSANEYCRWRDAGATRYILKVETTDEEAFDRSRTGTQLFRRVSHLLFLRSLGFKIGSGVICGLPGQTTSSLAGDLLFLKALQPDMASVSRFLPNAKSRYADEPEGDRDTTLNVVSLLRIILDRPGFRIPASTTLGVRQVDGLLHGANVVSFHATPPRVADLYSADVIHERDMTIMDDILSLSKESGLELQRSTSRSCR
jgi:biotin synthase